MIPGPYSLCKIEFADVSDRAIYHTVKSGYDSARQAFDALADVSADSGIPVDDLVVIRFVDPDEAERFAD
jgi:hypothetical protein